MLDDLRAFAAGDRWPRRRFPLAHRSGLRVRAGGSRSRFRGKIDRLDMARGRARLRDRLQVQRRAAHARTAWIPRRCCRRRSTCMAAERVFGATPAGMFYIGLEGRHRVRRLERQRADGWPSRPRGLAGGRRASARCGRWRRSARAAWSRRRPTAITAATAIAATCAASDRAGRAAKWRRAHEARCVSLPRRLAAMDIDRSHQDTCVVAGPGSGKTTVLVEYFRRLVEAGADPLRILAITFTEKAAGNMRDKLAEAFRDEPGDPRPAGARVGLDGPRLLRAAAARECRVCRNRSRSLRWPTSAKPGGCSRNPWRRRWRNFWRSGRRPCGR